MACTNAGKRDKGEKESERNIRKEVSHNQGMGRAERWKIGKNGWLRDGRMERP